MSRELGNTQNSADALYQLGLLTRYEGDVGRARGLQGECLKLRWESGSLWTLGASLDAIAALEAGDGRIEQAAWLWGAAQAWR